MGQDKYDVPKNWDRIEQYVITKQDELIRGVLNSSKCFFYDACTFRNHCFVMEPGPIFEYVKSKNGIVILTKTIIMELCSNDHKLWDEHIRYLKRMAQCGISVYVIAEEDVFTILNACYSGMIRLNEMLSCAVRYAKNKTGAVENVLGMNPVFRKELLSENGSKDGTLAKRFFEEMRKNKVAGDNMGEELIAICLHMLANIKESVPYKYIMLTDDYAAITLLGKVMENTEKHMGVKCMSGVTTAKLCWLMMREGMFFDKTQIEDIMNAGQNRGNVRVYASEQYELGPSEKWMSVELFVERLMNDKSFKVYI